MKKIISILLALTFILAFAACGKENNETKTSASEETQLDTEPETTEAPASETTEIESTQAEIKEEESTTEKATEETTEESTTETAKAPSSNEEIIAFYNEAVNNAFDKKAGFSKERYTDNENMDMSMALRPFSGLVKQFVGIGSDNKYTETVTKGKWDDDAKHHYLRKSTLSTSDITAAKCEEKGDNYIITLNVKGGNSHGGKSNKFTNAPIDKCGICVGNEDKGYYDHKTGEVIYDAIAGTYEGAEVDESYKNAVVKAEINSKTNEIVSLTVEFNISVGIDISIGSGTATGITHIKYTNFKY